MQKQIFEDSRLTSGAWKCALRTQKVEQTIIATIWKCKLSFVSQTGQAGSQNTSTAALHAAATFKEIHKLHHTTVSWCMLQQQINYAEQSRKMAKFGVGERSSSIWRRFICYLPWRCLSAAWIYLFPQILLPQRQAPTRHHNRNNRSTIGAGIQSIRKLWDTSRQVPHCGDDMSSAIVLESAIVHVYAINQDGLCKWKQIPRLLEAVSGSKAVISVIFHENFLCLPQNDRILSRCRVALHLHHFEGQQIEIVHAARGSGAAHSGRRRLAPRPCIP